jgi:thiosulfate/3-mercaptopyruvate sulfurtransferase
MGYFNLKFSNWSLVFFSFFLMLGFAFKSVESKPDNEPWKTTQLLSPADLAKTLSDPKAKQPIVFCIGPGAMIKGSVDIGPAKDSANLNLFKQKLSQIPKDTWIVIYCGCCPFEHCPNIRPAFALLNEMKFSNQKLLNLEHNLRVDWINKGYPVSVSHR